MTSILSPIPKFIFTVFEPLSLLAGFISTISDPEWFIRQQIVFSPPEKLSLNSIMVALQLGNIYGLLAMAGIAVLYTTTEPKVVRNYIIACLIADIGHLACTYYVLGYDRFIDMANWNAMAWGNIAVTVMLLLCRSVWLAGLFGPDQQPVTVSESEKSK